MSHYRDFGLTPLYEEEVPPAFCDVRVDTTTTTTTKRANLGVMLGVYLPTIQHILGVTMFIRLPWCVGVAGLTHTCLMLIVCCLCTFLTCISVSAVATNGAVEGGGAYFIISRNLGPQFGSAVGILFYLANTVATAMYLVGGVEILLLYIVPSYTIGGPEVHTDTGFTGMMSHNMRLYGTALLIVEFVIVAMGVRFVQLLAPVSLLCVILSILACYAGSIEKTLDPTSGQMVCMVGDHLLQAKELLPKNASISDICKYCTFDAIQNFTFTNISHMITSDQVKCVEGYLGSVFKDNVYSNYPGKYEYAAGKAANQTLEVFQDVGTSFFLILAIYFPAVTGILTGTNMSGDLANPQKTIPGGTIAAQLTTSFIYFSLAFVFGATIRPELLRDKYGQSLNGRMVVALLAWPSEWVLLVGSFLSTFGAALQCLCSAPRLLQSIAKDNVIPSLYRFSKVTKSNEPFYGLLLTTFIAELAILMGSMDMIAAVLDFFFLMCYAFVNIICALHAIMGAPNWRPRYVYYHWSLSLLGALLCFFIMFFTHWYYALASIILCFAVYKYVEWKGAKKEWGDGIRGLALTSAQYSLMKIADKVSHPKNWRPQLLIILSIPWDEEVIDVRYTKMLSFAAQLKSGKGLTLVVSLHPGNPDNEAVLKLAQSVKKRIEGDMLKHEVQGFAKTVLYDESQIGGTIDTLIQSIGIGGLKPNMLLLIWPTKASDESAAAHKEYRIFVDKLLAGVVNGMALLVMRGIAEFPYVDGLKLFTGYMDVYWIVKDGGLSLLITYLLRQHNIWKDCKTRIIAVATKHDDNKQQLKKRIQQRLYSLRIDAEILITQLNDPALSKSAYERTLLMDERIKLLKQMQQRGGIHSKHFSAHHHISDNTSSNRESDQITIDNLSSKRESDQITIDNTSSIRSLAQLVNDMSSSSRSTQSERGAQQQQGGDLTTTKSDIVSEEDKTQIDGETSAAAEKWGNNRRKKVLKMHGAIRLNELIIKHSSNSQLVLLSLPKPPSDDEAVDEYIHYLEVVSDKLQRVLFVRGTGAEVITARA